MRCFSRGPRGAAAIPVAHARQPAAHLEKFPQQLPKQFRLSIAVLKYALGEEWLERHIGPHARRPGVLNVREEESEEAEIAKMRMVELSESLFNLRRMHGITGCLENMKTAPNPSRL